MLRAISASLRQTVRQANVSCGEGSCSRNILRTSRIHSSALRQQEGSSPADRNDAAATSTNDVDGPSPSSLSQPYDPAEVVSPMDVIPESFRPTPLPGSSATPSSEAAPSRSPFSPTYSSYQASQGRMHRLHIQATRNNTLLTLTTPDGAPIRRVSAGAIGFRKAQRSGYEAGYRVAMAMFEHIETNRVAWQLSTLELIWKGFGQGRDAVYRAMMANEGTNVRNMVGRMRDGTPIKIGGVRPKKRRML